MSSVKIKDSILIDNVNDSIKIPIGNYELDDQPYSISLEQLKYHINSDLSTVATTGSFNDLTDKPDLNEYAKVSTINANFYNKSEINSMIGGSLLQVQSDWNQLDTSAVDYIKNKPNLSNVATTGSYTDLSNKPHIPNKTRTLLITYEDESTERIEVYTVK